MRKYLLQLVFLLALNLLSSSDIKAASRSDMRVAPADIFKSMFEYAQTDQTDKISESITYLQPVFESIESRFKIDMARSLSQVYSTEDKDKYIETIREIVIYDMLDLFEMVKSSSSTNMEKKILFKLAYADYMVLANSAAGVLDFEANQRIKKLFRKAYKSLDTNTPYINIEKTNNNSKTYVSVIKYIKDVFISIINTNGQ